MRILVVSHEWDDAVPGGAQRSATALARALAARNHDVTLASVVDPSTHTDGVSVTPDTEGLQHLLVPSETHFATFSWSDPAYANVWQQVLKEATPDVVHLHHYYKVGMELPGAIRRVAPTTGIVLTLHEYLAICLMSGQMVDPAGHLCLRSSVSACASCVAWPEADVAGRRDYIRLGLDPVDLFVTPSHFAQERYTAWGIDSARIRALPNVVDARPAPQPIARAGAQGPGLRLGYLGQHTPFKGLEVLLDAVRLADEASPGCLRELTIYGGGSHHFGEDFVERLDGLHEPVAHVVRRAGAYRQEDLPRILSELDALVVPSTWWENSPVVIEEALAAGVPVICSDIGGMAEKVRHDVDGWHFAVGNPTSLADLIVDLSLRPSLDLPRMRRPASPTEVLDAHETVYREAIRHAAAHDGAASGTSQAGDA